MAACIVFVPPVPLLDAHFGRYSPDSLRLDRRLTKGPGALHNNLKKLKKEITQ
jgi:hypothetical protein